MNLPFAKHTLANGLDVLLHEDHACPIVAVNLWYHVGSKNERPGKTGFAHLFEHLMFEGSEHYDRGYFHPLQGAGASLNGSTNADRTNYWEVVPSSALELALWMESDRMGYLLPALTEQKFQTHWLGLTIPFPLYGIFRYLYLVHLKEGGGSPTSMLINDRPLLICVGLWAAAVVVIVYRPFGMG